MPLTDSFATSSSDAELNSIYDGARGVTVGHVDSGAHTVALRAVFDRGMERGELEALRACRGRIIFLHQTLDERLPFMVDHIGAVHHNPNSDHGSLVVVDGLNVPVDEPPHEILKLLTGL